MELFYKALPFFLYCVVLLIITWRLRAREGDAGANDKEFFLAGRRLGPVTSFISVIATETSVATIVIFPAVGRKSGIVLIWLCLGFILGRLLVAAYYLRKLYQNHGLSIYNTMTNHHPGASRFLSAFYLLSKYISGGVRFYLGAFALAQLFGGPVIAWIGLTAIIVGLYSLSGGMRAVVITDQLQGYIIFALGIFLLFYFRAQAIAADAILVPPAWLDLEYTPHNALYFAALVIGGGVLSIGTHGADQDLLQRVLAVRDLGQARRALVLSALGASVVIITYLLVGHYMGLSHPHLTGKSPLTAFAAGAHPLLFGCFAVLLIAAAMSTLDSAIHSTGAVWKAIFTRPGSTRPESAHPGSAPPGQAGTEHSARFWSALSLALMCLFAAAFIILDRPGNDFLSLAMGSMNYVNGGLIAVLTVSVFLPRMVSPAGVLAALPAGFAMTVLCNFFVSPAVAWTWVIVLSSGTALAAYVLASFVWSIIAAKQGSP